MYNGIQKIEAVIDRIEAAITEEPDCRALAAQMELSVYEFRRIFAFLVGCPLSEYLRRRRLSLAACEMMRSPRADLGAIGAKYGYSSQSAFTKAFSEQHGVPPTACLKGQAAVSLFTRPRFAWSVGGRETVPLNIQYRERFAVQGYTGSSDIRDTCCCEAVWNAFYDSGVSDEITADHLYAVYENRGDDVICTIGQPTEHIPCDGVTVAAGYWVGYTLTTVEDDAVSEIYGKLLYEWLPSADLRRDTTRPTVEVYPVDMSEDGFEWEIRIPVCEIDKEC